MSRLRGKNIPISSRGTRERKATNLKKEWIQEGRSDLRAGAPAQKGAQSGRARTSPRAEE